MLYHALRTAIIAEIILRPIAISTLAACGITLTVWLITKDNPDES